MARAANASPAFPNKQHALVRYKAVLTFAYDAAGALEADGRETPTQVRCRIAGLCALTCALLVGCAATVTVTPSLTEKAAVCQIRAAVWYDGKPEYLPEVLIADASARPPAGFRYSYEARYGLDEYNAFLVAVNPLSLVGFPTGKDNVVVTGRVDLMRGKTIVRTYAAAASLRETPTIFGEGETFTDMRHRGLMLVRENLSTQLCEDQAALRTLLSEPEASEQNPT
jgi:hypothetical protein